MNRTDRVYHLCLYLYFDTDYLRYKFSLHIY